MNQQVHDLLKKKDLKGALEILKSNNNNAALVLADYENEKKWHQLSEKEEEAWQVYLNELVIRILQLVDEGEIDDFLADGKKDLPSAQGKTTGPTVFISYSTKDRQLVDAVTAYLQARHFDFFIDRISMVPGDVIRNRLTKEIIGRDVFVILLSENSLRSPWVCMESSIANIKLLSESNRVIPVKVDGSLDDFDMIQSTQRAIADRIKEMDMRIEQNKKYSIIGQKFLDEERQHYTDFLQQYDSVVAAYRRLSYIDISGNQFDEGMEMLVKKLLLN